MAPDRLFSVFVTVLSVFSCSYAADDVDFCRTPKSIPGNCLVITQCPKLFVILQHRPIKPADANLLRASQCGFEGTLPKVCCPTIEDTNEATSESPANYETAKPAASPLLPSHDECGIDSLTDKIYGGEVTDISEFPWMVLIEYQRDNGRTGFYCGGVLISKRYVLTAAHCLKGKDLPSTWKLISVRLGEYNTDTEEDCQTSPQGKTVCAPPPLNIPIEEQIAHENYNPYDTNQYHDIALLRLARDAAYSAYVKPICLPNTEYDQSQNLTNRKLIVAGWGKTETRSESNVKLKLNVPVKSNTICTNTYHQANVELNNAQICAGGERGKDSCRGDSGGPLMRLYGDERGELNWYSIGVVSFGPSPCGMENWPGVYTKVANYVPWIVKKLRR